MDLLPLASLTAARAQERHFAGARVDGPAQPGRPTAEPRLRTSFAGLRAHLAGALRRIASAVEPRSACRPTARPAAR